MITPVVLLARQERTAFEDEDALAARGESMQQRPAARAGADDDDVVVVGHDTNWSGYKRKPYREKQLGVPAFSTIFSFCSGCAIQPFSA